MCISGVIYSTGECCHTIEYSSPRRVTPFEYSSPKFATCFSPTVDVINSCGHGAAWCFVCLYPKCPLASQYRHIGLPSLVHRRSFLGSGLHFSRMPNWSFSTLHKRLKIRSSKSGTVSVSSTAACRTMASRPRVGCPYVGIHSPMRAVSLISSKVMSGLSCTFGED